MIKSKIKPPVKASEVLIEFAKPVIDQISKQSNVQEIETLLSVPVGIWNIHSVKHWETSKIDHRKDYLDTLTKHPDPNLKEIFYFWEHRRLSLYPKELSGIDYKVVFDLVDPQVIRFQVFVRLPEHLRGHLPSHWGLDQIRFLH